MESLFIIIITITIIIIIITDMWLTCHVVILSCPISIYTVSPLLIPQLRTRFQYKKWTGCLKKVNKVNQA